jgi:hypothetical protein
VTGATGVQEPTASTGSRIRIDKDGETLQSSRASEIAGATGTALLAVSLAAFPAIYTLDPTLAEHGGFWRSARWALFSVWLMSLCLVAYKLADRQARTDRRLTDSTLLVEGRLGNAIDSVEVRLKTSTLLWEQALEALNEVSTKVAETFLGMASMDRVLKLTRFHQILSSQIVAVSENLRRLDGRRMLPAAAKVAVFAASSTDGLRQQQVYPQVIFETPTTPNDQAFHNIFRIAESVSTRHVLHVIPSRVELGRLPRPWQDTNEAVIAPIFDSDARVVGTLAVCFPFSVLKGQSLAEDVKDRCMTMAEEISEVVHLISRELLDTKTGDESGEVS